MIADYSPPVPRATLSLTPSSANAEDAFDLQVRRRRQSCECGWQVTCEWVLDGDDTQRLRDFHRTRSGRYFQLSLPDYTGLKAQTVRFAGPLSVTPAGGGLYTLSTQLYWPDPHLMDRDTLAAALWDALGIDGPGFEQPLHRLVNTDWPGLWSTP